MNEEDILLTSHFLSEKLDQKARKQFELRLQKEPELAEEYATQLAIRLGRHIAIQEEVHAIAETIKTPPKTSNRRKLTYGFISAVAASFLLWAAFNVFSFSSNHSDLFKKYYKAYPSTLSTLGLKENRYKEAFRIYNEGNYQAALNLFDQLDSLNASQQIEVAFFQANAHLSMGKSEVAISWLELVISEKEGPYYSNAVYYLGLAYLAAGETALAKSQFQQVLDDKEVNQNLLTNSQELILLLEKDED